MSLSLYSITVHHALCFITDSCVSLMDEVGLIEKGIVVVLSRGQGKEKVWQGLADVDTTKTEGFNDERLEDEWLA